MPSTYPLVVPYQHAADIELPRQVEKLYDLAYNLWWTWSPQARELFASIDARAWSLYHNPVQLLINVERSHWETLLESDTFLAHYQAVIDAFERYMAQGASTWYNRRPDAADDSGVLAYFSMEYGVHQSLALYSGGLGVLSGDHCKSASDLGIPFVAVGLLYRHGYFRQSVDPDGHQQHNFPEYDFTRLPLRPVARHTGRELRVEIPFPDRTVYAQLWVAQVGRVPLLLLDTDVTLNDPADRPITSMLYVRGREMRLAQEIMLGVGGVRALRALGIEPAAWHINEGHSAFLQVERIREEVEEHGATLAQAKRRIAANTVFTTHTPVPAGHEQYDPAAVKRYFEALTRGTKLKTKELLPLGNTDHGEANQQFNMTALSLHTAGWVNGVSKLNAEVSQKMWAHLLGDGGTIHAVTNGVHSATWVGPEMQSLLVRWFGADWAETLLDPAVWQKMLEVPAAEIWQVHQAQKARLGRFMRSRLREQFARHGRSPEELRTVDSYFDLHTLTIGFARRFATYKRADLFFSDLHRLRRAMAHPERPIQIVLAGKAHPADRPGQELIQHIFQLGQSDALRGRVFFVEDYDMRVARMLVQGVDVWLNTPRRPMEASGTSGQKAAINGALNFSVLDGWWPEAYDETNGWVIGNPDEEGLGPEERDQRDASSLYTRLEEEIVPTYYERDDESLPQGWIERMKRSIAGITPHFSSHRMVAEYVERAYLPAMLAGAGATATKD